MIMRTDKPAASDITAGFSADGYIVDQDFFAAYRYRTMTSDVNGCGWIAAYNLLRAIGADVDFDTVRREMDAMIRLRVPGPTPMRVLRTYIERTAAVKTARGRGAAYAAARSGRAGILRYWEGREPHYVTFVRQADGTYRFFNVAAGLEDFTCAMEDFFSGHCRHGSVYAFVVE